MTHDKAELCELSRVITFTVLFPVPRGPASFPSPPGGRPGCSRCRIYPVLSKSGTQRSTTITSNCPTWLPSVPSSWKAGTESHVALTAHPVPRPDSVGGTKYSQKMEWVPTAYDLNQSRQQPCPAGEKGEKEPTFSSEGPSTKHWDCLASHLQHSLLLQREVNRQGEVRSLAQGMN